MVTRDSMAPNGLVCPQLQSRIPQFFLSSKMTNGIKSLGQTDWQVVWSGRKLNLRRDLALGGQTARKFLHFKDILRQTILYYIGL